MGVEIVKDLLPLLERFDLDEGLFDLFGLLVMAGEADAEFAHHGGSAFFAMDLHGEFEMFE